MGGRSLVVVGRGGGVCIVFEDKRGLRWGPIGEK